MKVGGLSERLGGPLWVRDKDEGSIYICGWCGCHIEKSSIMRPRAASGARNLSVWQKFSPSRARLLAPLDAMTQSAGDFKDL